MIFWCGLEHTSWCFAPIAHLEGLCQCQPLFMPRLWATSRNYKVICSGLSLLLGLEVLGKGLFCELWLTVTGVILGTLR